MTSLNNKQQPEGESVMLTTEQAADYLGVAAQSLQKWRRAKKGPPFVKYIGIDAVRYDKAALDAYIEASRVKVG